MPSNIVSRVWYLALLVVVMGSGLTGCVSEGTVSRSQMSYGEVTRNLIKGKTRGTDVKRLFGLPDRIGKNELGNPVWTYERQSYGASSVPNGASAMAFNGGTAMTTGDRTNFDLVITFDANDILQDYSMVSPQF